MINFAIYVRRYDTTLHRSVLGVDVIKNITVINKNKDSIF